VFTRKRVTIQPSGRRRMRPCTTISGSLKSGGKGAIPPSTRGRVTVPPLGSLFQTRLGVPSTLVVSVALSIRLYCPHLAVTARWVAAASTQKLMPKDDGNMVGAAGAVVSAGPSSALLAPSVA